MRAVFVGVVAALAVISGSALASAQRAWVAATCGEPPLVEHPSTISISCDSHLVLTHLHWTSWGESATTATGTLDVSEGCPTSGCAAPAVDKYAVSVRASEIGLCPGRKRTYKQVVARIVHGTGPDGKRTFADPLGSCTLAGAPTVGLAFTKFAHDREYVWVAAANGSGKRKLGPGGDPSLSPDGTMVAATTTSSVQGRSFTLYKVSGGTVPLPAGVTHVQSVLAIGWSPDSRYLAVAIADTQTGTGQGNAAIDVIDVATATVTVHEPGVAGGGSFQPGSSDTFAYSVAHSQMLGAPTNLYVVPADGSRPPQAVTTNGRSQDPVWGAKGIAFDLVTQRGTIAGPVFQIALLHGSTITQITHTHPSAPVDGLAPVAVSSNGVNLVADFVGTDDDQGYAVNLSTHKVKRLAVGDQETTAFGISADGRRVLVGYGGFEQPASPAAKIATIRFTGGAPTVLVGDAEQPSWNR